MLLCKQGGSEWSTSEHSAQGLSTGFGGHTVASTGGKRQLGASRMLSWLCSLWATGLWAAVVLPSCQWRCSVPSSHWMKVDESKWHPVLRMCIRKRMGSISSFREL